MTPQQVELVQRSWQLVAGRSVEVAALTYQRFFELGPEHRRLFHADTDVLVGKLAHMLNLAVTSLREFETIVPALEDLGRRHADYGVTGEIYRTMG